MYSLMLMVSENKAGSEFKELADELGHAVVLNKSPQMTQWARAILEGFQSFFRNAGTIYNWLGVKEQEFAKAGNITKQNETREKSEKLQYPKLDSARSWTDSALRVWKPSIPLTFQLQPYVWWSLRWIKLRN